MKYLVSGLALAIVAVGLVACGPYSLTSSERDAAELGALKYATASGGKFISCSGQDSDGDKYVTCTITNQAGASEALLCSYLSPGCKAKS